ncbi:AEC family transporter [Thalassolituus oleivorans]|uniref:Predicted Permease n=1 Tax=Thalassolituus oleivorans MIL-1 TaxID=1298593 RepID=M5DRT8_9GAMM|nr:AEC family transporter [Thalassolituus oleivorans]CCU72233.1 predicted Permease [Thalassolituus oleivorans MIL-1]
MYWQTLLFTLETTMPVILLVVLGIWLKYRGIVDSAFVEASSKLVFRVSLPVLMFMAIATADIQLELHLELTVFVALAAVIAYFAAVGWATLVGVNVVQYGAFVQASFRSNLGIVGLALCINAYGDAGAVLGALVLAVVTPIYNLLSVWVLAQQGQAVNWRQQWVAMAQNPLIIAIVLAVPFSVSGLEIPTMVARAGNALASMTLPLALIGIGASLSASALKQANRLTWHIVGLKLLILPSLVGGAAWCIGFRHEELAVIVLMFASPTAAAAFVMAGAMKADVKLTANAIALTTLGAGITVSGFVYVIGLLPLV